MLIKGAKFLKFGRGGWFGGGGPHMKFVYCDLDGTVYWADTEATDSEVSNVKAAHKFSIDSSLSLGKATQIVAGKTTDVLKRHAHDRPDDICFSIVLADRTLDLACTNKTQRDMWVTAFKFASKNLKKGGSIGLLARRVEAQVDRPSEDKLADMLKLSSQQFGTGHAPAATLLPEMDLRTKDRAEAVMYGLESTEDATIELLEFRAKVNLVLDRSYICSAIVRGVL